MTVATQLKSAALAWACSSGNTSFLICGCVPLLYLKCTKQADDL